MTGHLTQIWRHPIKGHGHEALQTVKVMAGATLPWDRTWAIAHEAAKADGSEWALCANFSRGAKAPSLMAIDAALDESTETLTLTHPEREPFTFQPDDAESLESFLSWVKPLMPEDRAQSARIVRVPGRGMTDTPYASVSLAGTTSLRALSGKLGQELDPRRFRTNFWVDGLGPWEEFEWIGKEITVGTTRYRVEERTGRCLATTANPDTGRRDAAILDALRDGWGHEDFGIYLVPLNDGEAAIGDPVALA